MLVPKHVLGLVVALTASIALPAVGRAQMVEDPLHGACAGGTATCGIDNTHYTPITSGPGGLSGFGWQGSPAQSGTMEIAILVPDSAAFGDGAITGTNLSAAGVTPTLVGTFSSGDLGTFLGIMPAASPQNPFGGFQTGLDSSVTSFQVWTATVGSQFADLPANALANIFAEAGLISAGTDFVAFLLNSTAPPGGGNTATALSGQLQLQSTTTPLPAAATMFVGGLGLIGWLSRRRRKQPVSIL
jgi:hypothetical protein